MVKAMIVRLHFGFDGTEPMTLERIGAMLGITRQRVRHLKETALSRIRKSDAGSSRISRSTAAAPTPQSWRSPRMSMSSCYGANR